MHIQISIVQSTPDRKYIVHIAGSKQGILYESYHISLLDKKIHSVLFYVLYDDDETYFIPHFKSVFRIFYLFIHRFVDDIILLTLLLKLLHNSMKR